MITAAPVAPGRIGEAIEPAILQAYLGELENWIRTRRVELDDLDQAALTAHRQGELTADIMLAMALWKAVSERHTLMSATWDGGRVGVQERERLSALIWGRLDATMDMDAIAGAGAANLAVSLPEACRLLDAMTGQLRTRLSLDQVTAADAGRVRQARAALERIRDQVALEPATSLAQATTELNELATRVADVHERAQRGADVGGLLGPLEIDLATFERDLIVGNAQRRSARELVVTARELRDDLINREHALAKLADTCVRTVTPAPLYAIPDVDALGPVPNTATALHGYLDKLQRVSAALTLAQQTYSAGLANFEELTARLEALSAKATALGVAAQPDVASAHQQVRDVLARRPCPMKVAEQLLTTYQTWLTWASTDSPPTASPRTAER